MEEPQSKSKAKVGCIFQYKDKSTKHKLSIFVTLHEARTILQEEFGLFFPVLKYERSSSKNFRTVTTNSQLQTYLSRCFAQNRDAIIFVTLPDDETVNYDGWMEKDSSKKGTKKRRYFLLTDSDLTWFVSEDKKVQKGKVLMFGCWVEKFEGNSFVLKKKGGKEYKLTAPSEDEKFNWMDNISRAILKADYLAYKNNSQLTDLSLPTNMGKDIIKTGTFDKRGHGIKSWKKRFFILTDVGIYYFVKPPCSPKDFGTLKGSMPLKGSGIAPIKKGALRSFTALFAESNTRETYLSFSTHQEMQDWMNVIDSAIRRCNKLSLAKGDKLRYETHFEKDKSESPHVLEISLDGLSLSPGKISTSSALTLSASSVQEKFCWKHPFRHVKHANYRGDVLKLDFDAHGSARLVCFPCAHGPYNCLAAGLELSAESEKRKTVTPQATSRFLTASDFDLAATPKADVALLAASAVNTETLNKLGVSESKRELFDVDFL